MVFGLSLSVFTALHVFISLIAIVSGIVTVAEMLRNRQNPRATWSFLITTAATSVTGFLFPFTKILPSHITGIISLVVLAVAIVALAAFHLAGAWRWVYVVSSVAAFYFNTFVLVAQAFLKVPILNALAPTGAEPPFLAAQSVVLLGFVALGFMAVRRFHPAATSASAAAAQAI